MLKGVNKQIIEVTDTGNQYIKKAILFVDPLKYEVDQEFLMHQAKKYIEQAAPKPSLKQKGRVKKIIWSVAKVGIGAAAGATLASLFIR